MQWHQPFSVCFLLQLHAVTTQRPLCVATETKIKITYKKI